MEEMVSYLQDVMGWTEYQAIAYKTLVQEGALEASELVTHSQISKGKEYEVLNELADRNVVVEEGDHPQKYSAQEPRQLLDEKENEIDEKLSSLEQRLGAAYEMRQERGPSTRSTWMSRGRTGLGRKVREYMEVAEDTIYLKLWDHRWLESTDIRDLRNKQLHGVDVKILCFDGRPNLDRFAEKEVPTWKSDEVETIYGVFDEEIVVHEVRPDGMGVGYEDKFLARVFAKDFQSTLERANKVIADA